MYSSSRHSCSVMDVALLPLPLFLPFFWARFSRGRLRSRKLWTWFVTPPQFWHVVVLCSFP